MTDYTDPFDPGAAQPAGDSSVDLSAYDAEFDAAQAPEMEEVPDGKYQIRINSVKLAQSQKGDYTNVCFNKVIQIAESIADRF